MKVAQITATFPPYMAGTGNVCYQLSEELAKQDHDVTVYTSRFPDADYHYPNTIKVKRYKPLLKIGSAPLILELLNIKNFDIIHLHYPYFFGGEIVYIVSKLFNQNYVITYHNDVIGSGIDSKILRLFFELHLKFIFKLIIKNAHKVIVPSIDFARNSNLKLIKDIDNLLVEIPNCVDINKFSPEIDCNDVIEKHNLRSKHVLLFVRALDKTHCTCGLEYLLKSIVTIERKDVVLLIVGDGDLKSYYQGLSEELKVVDKVIFAGNIPNEQLPKYYTASDIFILPSVESENFPLVILEAFSCAKPVITSNLPGVRSLIDEGVDGLLTIPKNIDDLSTKIQYLLNHPEVRTSFGINGRNKVVKNYSWKMIAKKLENIYSL